MNWNPCEGATLEARTLYAYMSDLSEENWAAGWMHGTEAACWEAVCDGRKAAWGMGSISPEQAADLKQLSDAAGGWWYYRGPGDPVFVSIAEWRAIYADRLQRTSDAEEGPA